MIFIFWGFFCFGVNLDILIAANKYFISGIHYMLSLAHYLHLKSTGFFFLNYKLAQMFSSDANSQNQNSDECTIYYLSQAAHYNYRNVQK